MQVPPATTLKSLGFALEDAIPKRQKDKLTAPVFNSVTVTGSVVERLPGPSAGAKPAVVSDTEKSPRASVPVGEYNRLV